MGTAFPVDIRLVVLLLGHALELLGGALVEHQKNDSSSCLHHFQRDIFRVPVAAAVAVAAADAAVVVVAVVVLLLEQHAAAASEPLPVAALVFLQTGVSDPQAVSALSLLVPLPFVPLLQGQLLHAQRVVAPSQSVQGFH